MRGGEAVGAASTSGRRGDGQVRWHIGVRAVAGCGLVMGGGKRAS
jgi:hypothetical protein